MWTVFLRHRLPPYKNVTCNLTFLYLELRMRENIFVCARTYVRVYIQTYIFKKQVTGYKTQKANEIKGLGHAEL